VRLSGGGSNIRKNRNDPFFSVVLVLEEIQQIYSANSFLSLYDWVFMIKRISSITFFSSAWHATAISSSRFASLVVDVIMNFLKCELRFYLLVNVDLNIDQ